MEESGTKFEIHLLNTVVRTFFHFSNSFGRLLFDWKSFIEENDEFQIFSCFQGQLLTKFLRSETKQPNVFPWKQDILFYFLLTLWISLMLIIQTF